MKYGVFPMDFIVESILRTGLDWFRSEPQASSYVFGQLDRPYLAKYGTEKIRELKDYISRTDIKIVQSLSQVDLKLLTISIQLASGHEDIGKAAIDDAMGDSISYDIDGDVENTELVGYSPITENILIGLHGGGTPDLPKYLYMLVAYILNAYKYDLEDRGVYLGTFSMTDLSRLNDYLPENVYSRFMTFTATSNAKWKKGSLPPLAVELDVNFDTINGTEETRIE
jgi:hypothetical protein